MSVFIIAEAGDNHNGSLKNALELVDIAVGSGADCVKFQTFITEEVISKKAEKANYQKVSTGVGESQFEMVKKLELSFEEFREIDAYCKERGIVFLSTPFDLVSIDFLNTLDMPFWKIPSGEITNLPYLIKIAQTNKDVVLSTGMSTIEEVRAATNVLKTYGAGKITILHCNTEYPTPMEDVNLNAMSSIQRLLKCDVGYSDHTLGIEVPIAAVALGAKVIEKHFTIDRNMEGPDHQASLEPDELKNMVKSIRNIEKALGNSEKMPSKSEIKNINIARKSIVARRKITTGEFFTEDNLAIKRPGNGISPMKWFDVLGQRASKDFNKDDLVEI